MQMEGSRPTPNDEQLYLDATQEVDNGAPDPALWAKAMALAEGDEEKDRYRYIALRVEKLSNASATAPPKDPAPIIDSGDEGLRSAPEDRSSVESSASPESKADDKPIPEGWVLLTGDYADERIEKIQSGKQPGFISHGLWYQPTRSCLSSKRTMIADRVRFLSPATTPISLSSACWQYSIAVKTSDSPLLEKILHRDIPEIWKLTNTLSVASGWYIPNRPSG